MSTFRGGSGWNVTLAYDALGRMTRRVEPEGTTTWTYDTSPTRGIGKLHTVSGPGGYAETHLYDTLGRPGESARTLDAGSGTFTVSTDYDASGRPLKITYPVGVVAGQRLAVRQVYNAFGYLTEIRHWLDSDTGKANAQLEGRIHWQAEHFGRTGRVDGETYGNGLSNDRVYSAATGRLLSANIDAGKVTGAPFAVQQLSYTYDGVGNVLRRHDQTPGFERDERFYATTPGDGYDGLDRLRVHRIMDGATVTVAYDQQGNITSKSDVGSYAYGSTPAGRTNALPHAVSSAGVHSYTYDANGNQLTGAGRTHEWSSFNQLKRVTTGGLSSEFSFGATRERVKQVRRSGSSVTETTFYVGPLYEKVVTAATNLVEHKHYILAPTGRIAVLTQSTLNGVLQANTTRYFHTDGLGSITVVSDEKGRVLKRYAYDAWGKQTTRYTNTAPGLTPQAPTTRGFTDHEMLAEHGLIHMNGRVYDPVLGRFLSADPFIDGEDDAQAFNRYSYVSNNPMNATDPSGYFKLKDALKIVAIVAVAVVGAAFTAWAIGGFANGLAGFGNIIAATANGSMVAGFAGAQGGGWAIAAMGAGGGFASGFAGSLLNGGSIGDAFKAGIVGGITGAIAAGVGHMIGDFAQANGWFEGTLQHASHGALQGGIAEATGGEFRHGFYAGLASSSLGGPVGELAGGSRTGNMIAGAIVGGTASALGGGKFANGAVSGAFTYMFNHNAHPDNRDFWQRASDFSAGFGDMISFGLTARFRRAFDYDDVVNYGSADYSRGEYTAVGVSLATGGAGAVKGALAMGGRSGSLLTRLGRGAARFFQDGRTFGTVSRQYWGSRGGAAGKHLHHWLFRQSGRYTSNAGYNLLELPGSWNSFMNGSGFVANALEYSLSGAILAAPAAGAGAGVWYGFERASR